MEFQLRPFGPLGCMMVCLLGACKPKQVTVISHPIPPQVVPIHRSALLAEPIAADTGAVVSTNSLLVHGLGWGVPVGWTLSPTKESPRIAEMRTPLGLEIRVFSFARGGGSIQANFQRWRDQMQPVSDSLVEIDSAQGLVRAVGEWTGDYRGGNGSEGADGSRRSLIGAVVEGPRGRVFFKVVGSPELVRSEKTPVIEWIRSVRKRN